MLADLAGELKALPRVGRAGGPAACPELRDGKAGKDLRHDAERAARARAGGRLAVRPVRRLIVAEVEGGPSGEEQCDGLPGRVVVELLRQLERHAEHGGSVGEVPSAWAPSPIEKLREHADERRFLQMQVAGQPAIATAASRSPA